jgi:hypothetical protein
VSSHKWTIAEKSSSTAAAVDPNPGAQRRPLLTLFLLYNDSRHERKRTFGSPRSVSVMRVSSDLFNALSGPQQRSQLR